MYFHFSIIKHLYITIQIIKMFTKSIVLRIHLPTTYFKVYLLVTHEYYLTKVQKVCTDLLYMCMCSRFVNQLSGEKHKKQKTQYEYLFGIFLSSVASIRYLSWFYSLLHL